MTSKTATLTNFDPDWSQKYDDQHDHLIETRLRGLEEIKREGAMSPATKAEALRTLEAMRRMRMKRFETPANVASHVFNVLACKTALVGIAPPKTPEPESFSSLREVREFYGQELQRIAKAKSLRTNFHSTSMPYLPKGEGEIFNSQTTEDVFTQAIHLPDIDSGVAFVLTTEKFENERRNVCLATHKHPDQFELQVPKIAKLLMERLFVGEDANDIHFYLHYPAGSGRNGAEQFWFIDLRQDVWKNFHFHGKRPEHLLPHGIANKQFRDGLPERETKLMSLEKGYDPYISAAVESSVSRQERITANKPKGFTFH